MKNKFIVLLYILLANYAIHSQKSNPLVIESKFSYAEKIYIQLSSSVFTSGNTVWFKAIVTDLAHVPTKLSGVLHVDLIDFDKRIIDKKLLKIENGTCDGFFDLQEDLSPGRYLIRAYTEWNKNFDTEFISQNYIDVYAPNKIAEDKEAIRNVILTDVGEGQFEISAKAYPRLLNPKYRGKLQLYIHTGSKTDSVTIKRNKDASYSFRYLLPKDVIKAKIEFKLDSVKLRNTDWGVFNSYSKTIAVDKEYTDLQFFPEGGKLVEGLTSTIAFKALDYNNKGKVVKGYIVDQNNEIIIPFQSNSLGMGISYITPEPNKTYYASIQGKDGIDYKFPLPKIEKTGVVLKIKEIPEYIVVALHTKNKSEAVLHVKVQSRGVEHDRFSIQLKDGFVNAGIEKSSLPEGILKITVENKMGEILCERLFFNFKEEDRIAITASPNLKQYHQRDKTRIIINTKDKDSSALVSNLSVLVIDKEQLGALNDTRSNLLSYFLLNSELKGTIEMPSSYFNKQNKSRKRDMNALLLTQGWSNYKYKKEIVQADFKYLPEKNLSVSGTVKGLLSSKKELKNPIELTIIYGPLNVATQQVDGKGNFYFQLEDYYKDTFRVMFQSKTKKGKKKDVTISLDSYKSPRVEYKKTAQIYLADSINTRVVEKHRAQNPIEEEYQVADGTIGLDEVTLKGYNLTPAREKMMDLHGPPDFVVENKALVNKTEKWHSGLFSLLQSSYPDDIQTIDTEGPDFPFLQAKVYGSNFTFIVIDGIPVKLLDYPFLESLPIEEIKSVELIRNPKSPNYYYNKVFNSYYNIYQAETALIGIIPDSTSPLHAALDGVGVVFDPLDEEFIKFVIDPRTSIISIYTYAGKGFNSIQRSKGIYKGEVQGFTVKREFYAPKYENEFGIDSQLPDVRSVVHWAPNIDTDADGEVQVEFYNGDTIGEMLVIIEGMTKEGKIGYYEMTYEVDKKEN